MTQSENVTAQDIRSCFRFIDTPYCQFGQGGEHTDINETVDNLAQLISRVRQEAKEEAMGANALGHVCADELGRLLSWIPSKLDYGDFIQASNYKRASEAYMNYLAKSTINA